jgi:hypothetical protein
MLRQHVEPAKSGFGGILRGLGDGVERGAALQQLEAVRGHQQRLRGLVHAVVRAPDPLHQPARALGRADIDDEIDISPVDAEIERGGADHGLEFACRHRRLDLAALLRIERAVMKRDRQIVLVDRPQRLEGEFRLHARVDEDQGQPVLLDRLVDVSHGVAGGVPRQRQMASAREDADARRSPAGDGDESGGRFRTAEEALQVGRLAHRRRQAHRADLRRERAQACEAEREQVAALGGDEGVELVEHDAAQA